MSLIIQKTDIDAQEIYSSLLVTYGMILAGFSDNDKLEKVWFIEETFLLAVNSMKVVLRMLFLSFPNADVQFVEKEVK